MYMYKVFFRDGTIRRAIKIYARSAEEAISKAQRMRKGHRFAAMPVRDDEHYASLIIR